MMHTFKDAKLFCNGVEIAQVESGTYEIDDAGADVLAEQARALERREAFTVSASVPMSPKQVEAWQWLLFRFLPSITPDGAVGRAILGVFTWRLLDELQAPLHRRVSMARCWSLALQPTYQVGGVPGLPRVRVQGDQRGVIEAFERIRREAGDFDKDELEVN